MISILRFRTLTSRFHNLCARKKLLVFAKPKISSKIFDELNFKGLIRSTFPGNIDANELLSKRQTIYAGFDSTNDSLHVGNLLVLISLLHLSHHGHRVIVVIGDATAQIGDPSGKATDRPVLSSDEVEHNSAGIESDILQVLNNYRTNFATHSISGDNFLICRNSSWYKKLNVIEFMNLVRHLRIGDMLNKTTIKERLASDGLSFTEFSYQTFQAYDWLHLFRKYNCLIQVGGVDQIVNIHNGYDLIKKSTQTTSYGLFIPLLIDDKGNKIGKSEGNPVFLNNRKTSEFSFFQFFMRLRDSDISQYLKLFSFRHQSDINNIIQNQLRHPKPWSLQKKLAEEMTVLVHGKSGLESAQRITKAIFDRDLDLLGNLTAEELQEIYQGAQQYHLEFIPGQTTPVKIAMQTECFDNEITAIQTIKDGGFYVNYARITDPSKVLSEEYILKNNITIISVGKRKYRLVRWL